MQVELPGLLFKCLDHLSLAIELLAVSSLIIECVFL